jgi:hypothetical protein
LLKELERLGREDDLAGAGPLLRRIEAEYDRVQAALEPLGARGTDTGGAGAPGEREG